MKKIKYLEYGSLYMGVLEGGGSHMFAVNMTTEVSQFAFLGQMSLGILSFGLLSEDPLDADKIVNFTICTN
jgi:hypothetical protein